MRSSVTREELGVEPLILDIERSQLRWLGHLMPPGRLPEGGVPGAFHREETPGKTQDMLEGLCLPTGLEHLCISPEEQEEGLGRGKSGHLCLDCCPRDPAPDKRKKMDGHLYTKDNECAYFLHLRFHYPYEN